MTSDQIAEALHLMVASMQRWADAWDWGRKLAPIRNQDAITTGERLEHLVWMADVIEHEFIPIGKLEKAFRWLGFIQGSLWGMHLTTIEDAKKANMPKDETFDKERV